ncbi:InlB B-repeat-containing protein, partial [Domibacillus mangrovi]
MISRKKLRLDTVIYAKWTVNEYKVTFNGTDLSDASITHGGKVTKPADPAKTGSTFGGWYADTDFETEFDFTKEITSDTVIYAKWTANTYTVTFETNSGSAVSSATVSHGSPVIRPLADPIKAGHTFKGWYKDELLTNAFLFDNEVITGETVIYAKWEANQYTVVFDSNEGSSVESTTVSHGEKITKPIEPAKAGYTFAGWYTDEDTTSIFTFESDVVTGDLTLYAKWVSIPYNVKFESNQGSAVADIVTAYGEKLSQPADPTKEGYTFDGWYKDSGLTKKWDFDKDTVKDHLTVYAKWIIKSHTVTFQTDGGTMVPAANVEHGQPLVRPLTDPLKTGSTFGGWYTDTDFE